MKALGIDLPGKLLSESARCTRHPTISSFPARLTAAYASASLTMDVTARAR